MFRLTKVVLFTRRDPRSMADDDWFAAYGVDFEQWLQGIGAVDTAHYSECVPREQQGKLLGRTRLVMPLNNEEWAHQERRGHESVERFLSDAMRLTDSDWYVIYHRYLARKRFFDLADRGFSGASIESVARRQLEQTQAQIDARGRQLDEASARAAVLGARVAGATAPEERDIPFQMRITWFLTRTMNMLWSLDRVEAVPKRLVAARRFVTLFDGFIQFPEMR